MLTGLPWFPWGCGYSHLSSCPGSFLSSTETQNLPLIKVTNRETSCAVGPKMLLPSLCCGFVMRTLWVWMKLLVCLSRYSEYYVTVPFVLLGRAHLSRAVTQSPAILKHLLDQGSRALLLGCSILSQLLWSYVASPEARVLCKWLRHVVPTFAVSHGLKQEWNNFGLVFYIINTWR